MARIWTLTASGIQNTINCALCAARLNGTFQLTYSCNYTLANGNRVCVFKAPIGDAWCGATPLYPWYMLVFESDTGGNFAIVGTGASQPAGLCQVGATNKTGFFQLITPFNCLAANTLTFSTSLGHCTNYPTTITVTPAP